jgi:UDP-glucose 6-dehydrogenase
MSEIAGKSLHALTTIDALGEADVVCICVGIPSKSVGTADLTYVLMAAMHLGEAL